MSVAATLPSEYAAVLANIDPDAYSTGTETSAWVPAKDFMAYLAVIQAGDLGSSATIDAKVEQAQDDSGTGVKDVASITQLTQADTDSDKQALINFRTEDLDVSGGFEYVRVSLTVGTASSDAAAILIGFGPRHGPASDQDADSVDEIVTA